MARPLLAHIKIKPTTATYRFKATTGEVGGAYALAKFYNYARQVDAPTIFIDFFYVSWIDAHLCACFAAIIRDLRSHGKRVEFLNLSSTISELFGHHGLIPANIVRHKTTVIPVRHFEFGQEKDFAAYTQEHFSRIPIPEMSDDLADRFYEGLDELFSNSNLHSRTEHGIHACGQFFPKKEKIDFSIVDSGIGFSGVINPTKNENFTSPQAIDWAMKDGHTTRMGDIPGGLGLKILKELIVHNGGALTIVSLDGFWVLREGRIRKGHISSPFPGTAVTVEINTNDSCKYQLNDEKTTVKVSR